jgi:TonB family protein
MYKSILVLILSFSLFHAVKAQDSTLYYIKYFHPDSKGYVKIVRSKDSAEYYMYLTPSPGDTNDEKKRIVKEFYIGSNNPKLTGTAQIYMYRKFISLDFDGRLTEYYPNGHLQNIINYRNGKPVGLLTEYFPDGNLYAIKKHKENGIEKYREDHDFYLLECYDTTGKTLAQNGNGTWKKRDASRHHIIEEGPIVDSLEEGEWKGYVNDTVMYYRKYHKGIILPTADTTDQINYAADREPEFTANNTTFQRFLAQNIRYPVFAKERQIQGKVYVTFIVEKDGSLTHVTAVRGPDQSLKDEAERCVKTSPPWAPAIINHKPVRFKYTIPVYFNLNLES